MEDRELNSPGRHVVVVGAGFAGLYCAIKLAEEPDVHITLLDRNNYQQFQPLLYQVATASLAPSDAAFNLRSVLGEHNNVDIVMTEVVSIDLATKTVHGSEGDTYNADFLVLAAGAEANFFGVPGVADYSFPLYSLRDAERLRSRIIEVMEAAELAASQGQEHTPHFAVVGGGATGVEISGALADIINGSAKKIFKHLDVSNVTVTLINGKHEVLSGFTPKSQAYAQQVLEDRKVQLLLGRTVKELTASELILEDGSHLACDIAIWAGGLKAAPIAAKIGLTPGRGGRLGRWAGSAGSRHRRRLCSRRFRQHRGGGWIDASTTGVCGTTVRAALRSQYHRRHPGHRAETIRVR